MQLVFTKGRGKYDRMDVIRANSPIASINCPKQGIIPHDMVHYAVESVLRKRGFIGRVGAGEAASLRMLPEAESDSVERLVEVFQADGWAGWNGAPVDLLELYRVTCRARACPAFAVTGDDIEAVRVRILELTAQWHTTAEGQTLTLMF